MREDLKEALVEVYMAALGLREGARTKTEGRGRKLVNRADWWRLLDCLESTEALVASILEERQLVEVQIELGRGLDGG